MFVVDMETVLAETVATDELNIIVKYMITMMETETMKMLPNMEGTAKTLKMKQGRKSSTSSS